MSHWTDIVLSGFYCLALPTLVFRYRRGLGISFATENKAERFLITSLMFAVIWIVLAGELEINLGYGKALLFSILWWAALCTMAIQVVVAVIVLISPPHDSYHRHSTR